MPISDFWISRGQTPAGVVLLIRKAVGLAGYRKSGGCWAGVDGLRMREGRLAHSP